MQRERKVLTSEKLVSFFFGHLIERTQNIIYSPVEGSISDFFVWPKDLYALPGSEDKGD